jgi:hypothetical protein
MPTSTHAAAHARDHINLRLERWHRRSVYLVSALLMLSGVAWLIARYFLRPAGEFGETIHPLEPWAMKLHGAAVMAMLFFLGSLMNGHIRRALHGSRNRVSGWAMMVTLSVLTFTGFGLYYLAGESDRPLWSAVHWIVGLALGLLLALHVVLGRRSRLARRAAGV